MTSNEFMYTNQIYNISYIKKETYAIKFQPQSLHTKNDSERKQCGQPILQYKYINIIQLLNITY